MNLFDFSNLNDLELTAQEKTAIATVWVKAQGRFKSTAWNCTQQLFFENFVRCIRAAVPCYAVPSIPFAQAIDESGWFSTPILFGVKATVAQVVEGDTVNEATKEVVNGKMVAIQGEFFHAGIQAQFANYYAYLTRRKPGTQQFLPLDSVGFIGYLQNPSILAADGSPSGAYSTAGQNYSDAILSICRDNYLGAFDHV